jgi:tRNA-Thr(GGU) m(6)t(6)A37 methyltransferase TsaA
MGDNSLTITPIGIIHTPFTERKGTPIQPSAGRGIRGTVELKPEYRGGLSDLEGFERIWLIYHFHKSGAFKLMVVPFRDTVERGLFSTRAPVRPNNIGLSCVRLVEVKDRLLIVEDVDMLDGTPLLDIKPYVPEFDAYHQGRTGWLGKSDSGRAKADRRFEDDAI